MIEEDDSGSLNLNKSIDPKFKNIVNSILKKNVKTDMDVPER
jgi:hypothetical protein